MTCKSIEVDPEEFHKHLEENRKDINGWPRWKRESMGPYIIEDHEEARITLKKADVDILMVPVVQWLTSLTNVMTIGCCQGHEDEEQDDPWISFMCCCDYSLETIVDSTKAFNQIYTDHYIGFDSRVNLIGSQYVAPALRLDFSGRDALSLFKEYMQLEEWK